MAWSQTTEAPGLVIRMKGTKGDKASIVFPQSEDAMLSDADAATLMATVEGYLEALSDALCFEAVYAGTKFVSDDFVLPTTGSPMQDVGVLVFTDVEGRNHEFAIPGFKTSKLVESYVQEDSDTPAAPSGTVAVSSSYGQQMINMADADVRNFVQFVLVGHATVAFTPCSGINRSGAGIEFTGIERGFLRQRESPRRTWRQG